MADQVEGSLNSALTLSRRYVLAILLPMTPGRTIPAGAGGRGWMNQDCPKSNVQGPRTVQCPKSEHVQCSMFKVQR